MATQHGCRTYLGQEIVKTRAKRGSRCSKQHLQDHKDKSNGCCMNNYQTDDADL
jgi:hypothetical protein